MLVLKGNGNVGIGVANPACKLDVAGTIRSSTNEIYGFGASDNVSLRAASTLNVLGIYTSNVERLRLAANGYFGVGTDNPSTLLSVNPEKSTLKLPAKIDCGLVEKCVVFKSNLFIFDLKSNL